MNTELLTNTPEKVVEDLRKIVGTDSCTCDPDITTGYLYDETEPLLRPKANPACVVVKPATPEEISQIVKYANRVLLPITVRGGATNVVAGAIPTQPSIILSLERLNKVIELDEKDLMITVESGVTLSQLMETLKKQGRLFFPVHPGDEGAQVGGMVAENAGGTRAVKHGIMRNHVKALEVVLPTGEIVTFGGKLLKNNMGLDLMNLMIGSEGTLGIITKVTLRLYAKNKFSGTLLVSFNNYDDATAAVPDILQDGITPLAIEYMDRIISVKAAKQLGTTWPCTKGSVDLMFIVEEPTEDLLYSNVEKIVDICEKHHAIDSVVADGEREQRRILEVRSNAYVPFKDKVADIMDVAVPPSTLPHFFDEVHDLADKYHREVVSLGHIGDGNIHNFILGEGGKLPDNYEELKESIYKAAIKNGGTVTAEHGTGKTRKKHMPLQFPPRQIELMKGIKNLFDPNDILSPGNIFD
ncbi:MAG: FAD-binding oxidoreductase [Oscillospiraceae bacterium]|jgi:glycolate oxidase|nr:FAD-binding oxidoreductase [Oscillospiraceae bacterium]